MNTDRTPEEFKQYSVQHMGEEIGNFFTVLYNEVNSLFLKWDEFVVLFGTNKEILELLNNAASNFFDIVQKTLADDVFLHISRLTDEPVSKKGDEHFTIKRIFKLIENIEKEKLKGFEEKELKDKKNDMYKKIQPLKDLVKAAVNKAESVRNWRHRLIAHKDLNLALKKKEAKPLDPIIKANVCDALKAIAAVLNKVAEIYFHQSILIDPTGECGARDLLFVIDDGLEWQKQYKNNRERDWDLNPDGVDSSLCKYIPD